MKEFYFNENDARYFISHHSPEEIKQEIEHTKQVAKEVLDAWSCLNRCMDIVINEKYYEHLIPAVEDDPYFQTKCVLSSRYVELSKYIEFLEKMLKENN